MSAEQGKAGKERLDMLLVSLGLAESRQKAQALIRAGLVTVDRRLADKPGMMVSVSSAVDLKSQPKYVSRGGDKLEAAIRRFDINVEGLVCLDVGSSTGGFTDCMLSHGAARVFAVDVGKHQLHWKLRGDSRVAVIEETNARYMTKALFDEQPEFAAVDVSFISLTLVLPAVIELLKPGSGMVTLIKPQFEAGRDEVGKGGVIRSSEVRSRVVREIKAFGTGQLGIEWMGSIESPLRGPAGNIEYLAWWRL